MMFSEQCWVCEITDTVPLGSIAQMDRATPRKLSYKRFRRGYTQPTCNGEDIVQTTTLVLLMVTEM